MQSFDFIIVGAGTAGCVLAARLSEDPDLRVGLIEAGGAADDPAIRDPLQWPRLQGSAIDWQFRTVPQRHTAGRSHAWPRGRVVGGSTALNAMAHVRGHPRDFDGWAADGCPGWSYRDLLPYFIRSETSDRAPSFYHGDSGPVHLMTPPEPHPITLAYMAAGVERGIPATDDHNGPCMTGPTLNTLTIQDGYRQSIADAYLTPAAGGNNLRILKRTHVYSLIFDRRRCRGVTVVRNGAVDAMAAHRGVVLAAGAIGSPVLLMLSGIGQAADLQSLGIEVRCDLPGVGRNLQDHLLSGGNVYRARRPVPPSQYQHSESLMYVDRPGGNPSPELVLACVIAPIVTEAFEAPPVGSAYTIMSGFTRPRSRGTVRLACADPESPPLIDPNYLAEAYDRDVFHDALELARAVGAADALADWRAEELLPGALCQTPAERRAFLQKAAYTHHHPVGTCRMGSDEDSVVGPGLAVHGTDGLYVVDASVFPRITTGPTNAAVIAVAERASDLLRGRPPLAPARLPADPAAAVL
jgi:choline dehydrogenase-like flavoprotein